MYQLYRNAITNEEVEAVQLTAENVKHVATWCKGQDVIEHDAFDSAKTYAGINVPSFMGKVRASEGDYIILNALGDFKVKKPGSFEYDHTPIGHYS